VRVSVAPNRLAETRLGLATPGIRGAVERNRLRRRLRMAARGIGAAEGYDLVVSVRPEAAELSFAELSRQVGEAAAVALERARRALDGEGEGP
jgi:ribonuclease P protein component